MSVTAAQITRVRKLSGNVSESDFDDDAITDAIELYPKIDSDGLDPADDDWTETYDLYRAAADIVDQRAAAVANQYDQNTDGASLNRSQKFGQLSRLATRLRSRGAPRIARPSLQDTYEDAWSEDDDDSVYA